MKFLWIALSPTKMFYTPWMRFMTTQIEKEVWQNELLTVKEVAKYLRVGRVTIWRWCQQGQIPASRVGRNWRIHRDDLFSFLKKHNLPQLDPIHNHLFADNDTYDKD
jgi:excisionase family DNA binding protein